MLNKLKMLPHGKELKKCSVVNANETKIIANDILLINQIFGGLPLKYTKSPNKKTEIEFSKALQMFGIVYLSCLMTWPCGALYYYYIRYLAGEPLTMIDTASTITQLTDAVFLNFTVVMIIITAGRKYSKLIEMCSILEKVDESLQQKADIHATRFKVLVTFLLITSVLTWTMTTTKILNNTVQMMVYLYKVNIYYTQTAMYLLFTSVTGSLTVRFRQINDKLKQELVTMNLKLLIKDLSLSDTISGTFSNMNLKLYLESEKLKKNNMK